MFRKGRLKVKGAAAIYPGDRIEGQEVTAVWTLVDDGNADRQDVVEVRLWDGHYSRIVAFPMHARVLIKPGHIDG